MTITSRSVRAGIGILVAAATVFSLSACAPSAEKGKSGSEIGPVAEGKLTIATGEPTYTPWVEDDKPESGKGFESAVAYAVAEQMGYKKEDVVWARTTFDSAITPGPKTWDLNIQQFSANDQRRKAVDFSSPYYVASQAVVADAKSPAASATTLDALRKVKLGSMVGTTSYTVAQKALGTDIQLFNNLADAVQALKNGQVDALVADLPTAFNIAGAELDNGKVVGQFADASGGDELSIVLPKGSSLTPKVSKALDTLRENGTLDKLKTEWLSKAVDAPIFK